MRKKKRNGEEERKKKEREKKKENARKEKKKSNKKEKKYHLRCPIVTTELHEISIKMPEKFQRGRGHIPTQTLWALTCRREAC